MKEVNWAGLLVERWGGCHSTAQRRQHQKYIERSRTRDTESDREIRVRCQGAVIKARLIQQQINYVTVRE